MKKYYLINKLRFLKIVFFLQFIFLISSNLQAQVADCSPNAQAGSAPTIICEGDVLELVGNVSGNSSGAEWVQVSGPSVNIDDPTSLTTTVTGHVGGNTYVFALVGECSGGLDSSDTTSIEVKPITEAVITESNITSCPSSGVIVVNGNVPLNGETILWSTDDINAAGVIINFTDQTTTTITLPETSCGTTTLRYTLTNEDAIGIGIDCSTYDEITITNYGGVTAIDAGVNQTLNQCYTATQSTRLDGSFAGCGLNGQDGEWSFVSGPTMPTFVNPLSRADMLVRDLVEGIYTFRWTVSGPCVSGTDIMTVTVPAATQDVSDAEVANSSIVFCDNSITETTLVADEATFAGETVEWTYIGSDSGVNIVNATSSTTLVTGLNGMNAPFEYQFRYTITNDNTETAVGAGDACDSFGTVNVSFETSNVTIELNNGNGDITGTCNQSTIPIPLSTSGGNQTRYRIVSGPVDNLNTPSISYPTSLSGLGTGNLSGGVFSLDFLDHLGLTNVTELPAGIYTLEFQRNQTGGFLTNCSNAVASINITIIRNPTQPSAGGDVTLNCGDQTTVVRGNDFLIGSSIWSQVDGPINATISDPYLATLTISDLSVPGDYVFRYDNIVDQATGCEVLPDDLTVTVISGDTATSTIITLDELICAQTAFPLEAATPDTGFEGVWTVDPLGPTFSDENDPNAVVSGMNGTNTAYVFTWTVSLSTAGSGNCTMPASDSVTITTNSTMGVSNVSAGNNICLDTSTTDYLLEGSALGVGETGEWTSTGPTIVTFSPDEFTPTAIATFSGFGTYNLTWTVTPSAVGSLTCQSVSSDIEIVRSQPIVAEAGTFKQNCSDTFTMDAGPLPSGTTGLWVLNSGLGGFTFTDETSPTSDITFAFSGTYVFDWVVSGDSCGDATDSVTIIVSIPTTQADAGDDQNICNDTQVTLDANDFDANTEIGYWTLLTGAPNSPTITNVNLHNTTVTGLVTGTYEFSWTIIGDSGCPIEVDEVTIEVSAPANAGVDQEFCQATSAFLEGTQGSTGTWTLVSSTEVGATTASTVTPTGPNIANASIVPGEEYVFQYEPNDITFNNGTLIPATCDPGVDTLTVSTTEAPNEPNAGVDQIKCLGDPVANVVQLDGSDPSLESGSVTGTWEVVFPTGGGGATFSSLTNPVNPENDFEATLNLTRQLLIPQIHQ